MRRIHADLLLLATAAIWGFAFLFQKSAMAHVGPLQFVAARSIVACLALLPFAVYEMRGPGPGWNVMARAAMPAGLVFFIGATLQQWGIVTASVTNTGFLTALYVVLTPFIAWALIGHRPRPAIWLAVALSFTGTWLLGGGTLAAFAQGDGLVAVSAVFWALHVVLTGRAGAFERPMTFTCVQFALVALLGMGSAPAVEIISIEGLTRAWPDIAFVGLLSSALTFTLFSIALRHTGPTEGAVIVSSETLFAAAGAWLFLGERLPWIGWAGAGFILGATLLVQLAPSRSQPIGPAARPRAESTPR